LSRGKRLRGHVHFRGHAHFRGHGRSYCHHVLALMNRRWRNSTPDSLCNKSVIVV